MRGVVGPIVVGAAVWCAAGALTVAAPDGASTRLAVPAAWWLFPLAAAAAALVPAWRRHPVLALPASLSTLPWWPIPLPAIALLWTGPFAWLPIAASLACAVGAGPMAAVGRWFSQPSIRRSVALAAAATLLAGAIVAWNVDDNVPGGDEPHYLVITQSLIADGDLRIENNHRQRDYAAYFGGGIEPHYVRRGVDGEIYSIHAPGVPALVLPAFALFGYRGVEILLLCLAAATGGLVWWIGWRATADAGAAWFAWAAIIGSATFLLHSFAVFPDGPGALIAAAAIAVLVRLRLAPEAVGPRALAIVSVLLAALPWFHTRFAVLAGGLGALVCAALLSDRGRPTPARRQRALLFLVVPFISATAWFGFFQWIYGTPNPAAPYGGDTTTHPAYVPGGLMGLLFDEQFGLLMHSPVLALALAGLFRPADRNIRSVARATFLVALIYLAAVAAYWLWWAGSPAVVARFAVAALPAFTLPLALAWRAGDAIRRRLFAALLAISLAIAALLAGVAGGDLAWNVRSGEARWLDWLGPVANLPRGFPSFFWALDPTALDTELPFFVHATAWMGVFVGGWILVTAIGEPRRWSPAAWRLAVCGWLLGGLMAATQIGWWLNDVSGLDAARSQTAVLGAEPPTLVIAPLSLRSLTTLAGSIRIRGDEAGRGEGSSAWLSVGALPAGDYALHITASRPREGELAVAIGGGREPIDAVRLRPENRQVAALSLPVGVWALQLLPSQDLDGIAGSVELEPVRIDASAGVARWSARYGLTRVFFLDDDVFVEPEGFWVQGGASATVLLRRQSSAASLSPALVLQNGRGQNEIEVEAGALSLRTALGSFETRRVELPALSGGLLHVTIGSAAGFRPADDGTSGDDRYLGVWVSVE